MAVKLLNVTGQLFALRLLVDFLNEILSFLHELVFDIKSVKFKDLLFDHNISFLEFFVHFYKLVLLFQAYFLEGILLSRL